MSNIRTTVLLALALAAAVPLSAQVVVEREIVGPMKTNSYLVYDPASRQAALIDPAGPVDRLLTVMDEKNLDLEYILVTHAHPDHVAGIPAIRECFPLAKLVISKEEYQDATALYRQWEKIFGAKELAEIKKDAVIVELMNFDPHTMGPANILVDESTTLMLGEMPIRAYLTPGHSRGSVCYLIGPILFSGDVLFHRRVGRSDFPESGGWDALVKSVRRLYSALPDDDRVYPGHGLPTDVGSEKRENQRISETSLKPPA